MKMIKTQGNPGFWRNLAWVFFFTFFLRQMRATICNHNLHVQQEHINKKRNMPRRNPTSNDERRCVLLDVLRSAHIVRTYVCGRFNLNV